MPNDSHYRVCVPGGREGTHPDRTIETPVIEMVCTRKTPTRSNSR